MGWVQLSLQTFSRLGLGGEQGLATGIAADDDDDGGRPALLQDEASRASATHLSWFWHQALRVKPPTLIEQTPEAQSHRVIILDRVLVMNR